MSRTLGLDIGSNSVGWALIDEAEGQLLAIGVRVFPEGVDRDTSGAEHSKNEQRRMARGHRRQIARRARRKAALRTALIKAGWWNQTTAAILTDADPYALRAKGLDQPLTLAEFGRVLMHLNQRRGFLSNRKADRGKRKENSETLQAISDLETRISESGARTLGEYLHRERQRTGAVGMPDRVRNLHTRRSMYEAEFDALWEKQREFHPAVLIDELKYGRQGKQTYPREPLPLKRRTSNSLLQEFGFHGLLFFQRSLYWPKSVVGRCELTGEKRCERADRAAQRFRMLNEVNNLRVIPQKGEPRDLTPAERDKLVRHLSKKKEADFDDIRKQLGLLQGDGFNLEAGSRKKLDGAKVDVVLAGKDLFGKSWHDRPEAEKDAIVGTLLNAEEPEILRAATREWGCSPEVAGELADIDLTAVAPGYASYSLSAIRKLLPHLERGLPMMSKDGKPSALSEAGFLRPDQRGIRQGDQLPLPSDRITNPLVRQALVEVRKIVHAVIREFGKPNAIHIELAREVQGTSEKRAEASRKMRERERRRDEAAEEIRKHGFKPSRDGIDRWLLWKEQGEICLYSGKPISPRQLLEGEADIDHILPFSRSLDNSLMNKVVAFRNENRAKGNRTPWEWLGESQPAHFEAILQRARSLPYEIRNRKLLKLQQKDVVLEQFLARQLTDTAYVTTQVLDLLKHLRDVDVVPVKGQLTAELRQMWGLNTVLRDDDLNLKNREDHRHHAVDALVIALTDRKRLHALARVRGTDDQLPIPFSNFRDAVEEAVAGIKVSHRAVRDLAGALHEETIYGPTSKPQRATGDGARPHAQGWIEEEGLFVVRKPLASLSLNEVDLIRDPQVKAAVIERLAQFGVTPGRKKRGETKSTGKIPKDAWNDPLLLKRKGHRVSTNASVIRKVRIVRREGTIQPIRGGAAWVKPGNTHHICIFELPPDKPGKKPKRDMIAVTMMEAALRSRRNEPLISRTHPKVPDARFLFSLSAGETVWANLRGREGLYVFKKASSTTGQMTFTSHTDARPSADRRDFSAYANTLDGVKVLVDPLGRIRNAND